MPRLGASLPVDGGGGFAIEFQPSIVGAEHRSTVRMYVGNHGARSRLTGTGMSAVLGVLNTYLTAGKASAIRSRGGDNIAPICQISPDGAIIDILPEDGAALGASLTAVLNVAANVGF